MTQVSALSDADRALIEAASDAIRKRYRYDWQEVGAALRTRSGKIFTGVSLDAYLGRMAVCAEAVALGQAITDAGETGIDTIVAVRHPPPDEKDRPIAVVSPCGACRELIWDYDRDARVIVPGPNGPEIGRRSANCCRTNTAASGGTEREHPAPPSGRRRAPRRGHRPRRRCARSGCPSSSASSRRAPTSRCSSRRRGRATRRSTMCCWSARRASARPRWRRSSSRELGVNFRATSGPVIAKAGDLAALLTNLEERDVLFIDEIHRLNPAVEEVLYPAMEDFQLDLIIGEGPAARSVKIDLSKFTLVGATTRAGLLTNPLRDRFGIPIRLNFYTEAELELIVNRGARVLGIGMSADGANEIARRSRGTPRIAGRLLRRVRDFAHAAGVDKIDRKLADRALLQLEVDAAGLDAMDRRYLTVIAENYGGGPVGVETLAAALSEPRDAIEEIIEPFLIQKGLLQRTPRGRLITGHAFKHLGLAEPARDPSQFGLFAGGDDVE